MKQRLFHLPLINYLFKTDPVPYNADKENFTMCFQNQQLKRIKTRLLIQVNDIISTLGMYISLLQELQVSLFFK